MNDSQQTRMVCPLCGSGALEQLRGKNALCRCMVCKLVFHNPCPSADAIGEFYSGDAKYDSWLARDRARERMWRRRLRRLTAHVTGGSLLDVGTGTGHFLSIATERFSEVVGTEVSQSARRIARERYGVDVQQGRLEDIDFKDKRFDAVTLFHVLEHVHKPGAVLRKCCSLLAPGGVLVIAVPNELRSIRARLKGVLKILLGRLGSQRFSSCGPFGLSAPLFDGRHDEIHLQYFTERVLVNALRDVGLAVVERGLDPYHAACGIGALAEKAYYHLHLAVHRACGVDLYDTVWVAATKTP